MNEAVEKFRGELAAKMRARACEEDLTYSSWDGNEPQVWREAAHLAMTMPFDEKDHQ